MQLFRAVFFAACASLVLALGVSAGTNWPKDSTIGQMCGYSNGLAGIELEFDSKHPIETSDRVGHDIAVAGGRIIVGAPNDEDGRGAVYVQRLLRDSNRLKYWDHYERVPNPSVAVDENAAATHFGTSVGTNGNLLAVGEPGADNNKGIVRIMRRSGRSTVTLLNVTHPDLEEGDQFGLQLSMYKYNLAVSAPYHDAAGIDAGAVFVFGIVPSAVERNVWTYELIQKIVPTALAAGDSDFANLHFGHSLSVKKNALVVGMPAAGVSGAVCIYNALHDAYDIWQEQHINMTHPNSTFPPENVTYSPGSADMFTLANLFEVDGLVERADFGWSVDVTDQTFIVGAPRQLVTVTTENRNGEITVTTHNDGGMAFFFMRNETNATSPWFFFHNVTHDDPDDGDNFGWDVAISGNKAFATSYRDDNDDVEQEQVGSATKFQFSAARDEFDVDEWISKGILWPTDSTPGDHFGYSIHTTGCTTVFGAPGSSTYAETGGSAWVNDCAPCGDGYFCTGNAKPDYSQGGKCVLKTNPPCTNRQTCDERGKKCIDPVVQGDPHIVGFEGQKFNVLGDSEQDNEVYNMVSSPVVQYNARFTRTPFTMHDQHATLISEVGVSLLGGFSRVRIAFPGASSSDKFVELEVNGMLISPDNTEEISIGSEDGAEQFVRRVPGSQGMRIHVSTRDIVLDFSGRLQRFPHIDARVKLLDWSIADTMHGLMGQTARSGREQDVIGHEYVVDIEWPPYLDGSVEDYRLAGDDLFGTDFVYNKFPTLDMMDASASEGEPVQSSQPEEVEEVEEEDKY